MTEQASVYETKSALGHIEITPEQVDLIKNTVANGATNDELKLFFFECRRRGVHPLDRLIHFVKRSGKATFQCGIDFMRSQAEASGQYRGQGDVEYGPIVNGYPEWAKATVRKVDPNTKDIYTTSATVYWEEFYPGEQLGFMWKKMPRVMLAKVAESQALRKAFPLNFNGLYTFEEMQQSDMVTQGKPKQETKTSTVKPNTKKDEPKKDEPKSDEPKKSPLDTLKDELAVYCNGDTPMMGAVLKELTIFTGEEDGREIFMSLGDMNRAKPTWIGKTLSKLRERVKAEGAGQDWCCGQKEACQLITWRGDIVWCEHEDKECSK